MPVYTDSISIHGEPRGSNLPLAFAPLIRKLEGFGLASDQAKARLTGLGGQILSHRAGEDIVQDGETFGDIHLLVDGVACRYKLTGERQAILGFLLPGDLDQPDATYEHFDHSIAAITACTILSLPRRGFAEAMRDHPDLARALERAAYAEIAVLRRWLANAGQSADKRTAHLLCELRLRFSAAGMGGQDWFNSPMTQEQLSCALGISGVHMNRMLQQLRRSGLIRTEGHMIHFPDLNKAETFAGFDPAYLGKANADWLRKALSLP